MLSSQNPDTPRNAHMKLNSNRNQDFRKDQHIDRLRNTEKRDISPHKEFTALYVGRRIKSLRKYKKLTQLQLSKLTGIDQANMSKMERGRNRPRLDTIEKIANGLRMSVQQLLGSHIDEV